MEKEEEEEEKEEGKRRRKMRRKRRRWRRGGGGREDEEGIRRRRKGGGIFSTKCQVHYYVIVYASVHVHGQTVQTETHLYLGLHHCPVSEKWLPLLNSLVGV